MSETTEQVKPSDPFRDRVISRAKVLGIYVAVMLAGGVGLMVMGIHPGFAAGVVLLLAYLVGRPKKVIHRDAGDDAMEKHLKTMEGLAKERANWELYDRLNGGRTVNVREIG